MTMKSQCFFLEGKNHMNQLRFLYNYEKNIGNTTFLLLEDN